MQGLVCSVLLSALVGHGAALAQARPTRAMIVRELAARDQVPYGRDRNEAARFTIAPVAVPGGRFVIPVFYADAPMDMDPNAPLALRMRAADGIPGLEIWLASVERGELVVLDTLDPWVAGGWGFDSERPLSIAARDLDRDGHVEVAMTIRSRGVDCNLAAPTYTEYVVIDVGERLRTQLRLTTGYDHDVSIYHYTRDGTVSERDIDADGHADLVHRRRICRWNAARQEECDASESYTFLYDPALDVWVADGPPLPDPIYAWRGRPSDGREVYEPQGEEPSCM